jgi:aquaporin NIP
VDHLLSPGASFARVNGQYEVLAGLLSGKSDFQKGSTADGSRFGGLRQSVGRMPRAKARPSTAWSEALNIASRKFASECIGTFALVFAGTGAIVIDHASSGAITHPGIALTFGLIILSMIYTFGDVSGAHFNPSVTIAFAAAGRFPWREVPGFVGAQLFGAFAASGLLRFLFPSDSTLGATLPAGAAMQSFILEVVLTFLLMLVILSVSTGAKEKGITAGIAIGSVIGLEAMFAGPICGASMNPARSLSPAIVSGHIEHLWIYIAGPVLGALLAIPACSTVRGPDCC